DTRIKILDFGLAKLRTGVNAPAPGQIAEGSDTVTVAPGALLTGATTLVGTVAYMSPEQARGDTLDTRTDLFSFGVVVFEMCAGRPPFVGRTWAVILSGILTDTPPLLSS